MPKSVKTTTTKTTVSTTQHVKPLFSWLWLGVLAFVTFVFACLFGGLAGYTFEYYFVPPIAGLLFAFAAAVLFIAAIVMFLFAKKNLIAEANVRAMEVFHGKARAV